MKKLSIGENLKRIRKKAGLTQEQLASSVGIKQCTLAQIERNTKPISLPLSVEVTKVLNCSIYDLLDDEQK